LGEHEAVRRTRAGHDPAADRRPDAALATRTIEAHLRNIYGKLGVRSCVELTRIASWRPQGST